jgi:hypothetical protein
LTFGESSWTKSADVVSAAIRSFALSARFHLLPTTIRACLKSNGQQAKPHVIHVLTEARSSEGHEPIAIGNDPFRSAVR